MNSNKLIKELSIYDKVDEALVLEFAKKFKFSKNLIKYQDDVIFDMHDHNYFYIKSDVSIDAIRKAIDYQKDNKRDYIKLYSNKKLKKPIVEELRLEDNTYISMLYKGNINKLKTNDKVVIKDIKLKDLNEIELKHYEKDYGRAFILKKNKAYLKKCKETDNLKYYGAYINDKIVGACYAYTYKGITCFDGLIVDNRRRRRHIASTLIKHIIENSERTMLHADLDGQPYKMYLKMGFKVVAKNYEYFRKIK